MCADRPHREWDPGLFDEVRQPAGARRPADVFKACGQTPQCGGCACDMRKQIELTVAREQAMPQTMLAAAD